VSLVSHLPPQHAKVPVELLYHMDLPASVRLTAAGICGLDWRHDCERMDVASLEELMEIYKVGQSTLYGPLAALGDKRVLRYTTVSAGSFKTSVFELSVGAPGGWSPASPDFWTDSTVVGGGVSSPPERKERHMNRQQQQQHHRHAVAVGGRV
jgi:hypothetical protein